MKKSSFIVSVFSASLLGLPFSAFAHELQVFQIGNEKYAIEAGSLNEPAIIDDTNGVFISVSRGSGEEDEETDHHGGDNAVEGLENTLKVEIIGGDKKKIIDLRPISGQKGQYQAIYIPTVQTTLSYRFFGTINAVPVDFSFTCNPAGHPQTDEDATPLKMSADVTRILKKGAFGCPQARADLGFPEPAATMYELKTAMETKGGLWGIVGVVLGGLGLIAGAGAWMKASQR